MSWHGVRYSKPNLRENRGIGGGRTMEGGLVVCGSLTSLLEPFCHLDIRKGGKIPGDGLVVGELMFIYVGVLLL